MNPWTKRISLFVSLVALLVVIAVIVNIQTRKNLVVSTLRKVDTPPRIEVAATSTEPLVTSDSPLPTPAPTTEFVFVPVPTSPITNDDYRFGTVEEVLVDTTHPLIAGWLLDNQTAMITDYDLKSADSANSYTLLQLLNVKTQERQTFATTGPVDPQLVWLQSSQKVAFLGSTIDKGVYVAFGTPKDSTEMVAIQGKVRTIAGRDNDLMVILWDDPFPHLFDGSGNPQAMPMVNLYDYGLNSHEPPYFPFLAMSWHPTDSKVAISDGGGFMILDVRSGQVDTFKLSESSWAPVVQWSPIGNKIALILGDGAPPFDETYLAILDLQSRKVERISTPLRFISDITWASNGRQILVGGKEIQPETKAIYLVDTVTQQISKVEQASQRFVYAFSGLGIKWSPDGHQILFRCQIPGAERNGLCKMTVELVGGLQ